MDTATQEEFFGYCYSLLLIIITFGKGSENHFTSQKKLKAKIYAIIMNRLDFHNNCNSVFIYQNWNLETKKILLMIYEINHI